MIGCIMHAPHAPRSLVPMSLQELSWANVVRGQDLAQNSVQRWLQCSCEQLVLWIFVGCQWVSSRIHATPGWFVLENISNVDQSIALQISTDEVEQKRTCLQWFVVSQLSPLRVLLAYCPFEAGWPSSASSWNLKGHPHFASWRICRNRQGNRGCVMDGKIVNWRWLRRTEFHQLTLDQQIKWKLEHMQPRFQYPTVCFRVTSSQCLLVTASDSSREM